MSHDPLCLEGLDEDERHAVITGVSAEVCTYCVLINKVREEEERNAASREEVERALRSLYSGDLPDDWMQIPNAHPLFAGATPEEYARNHGYEDILALLNGWLN